MATETYLVALEGSVAVIADSPLAAAEIIAARHPGFDVAAVAVADGSDVWSVFQCATCKRFVVDGVPHYRDRKTGLRHCLTCGIPVEATNA